MSINKSSRISIGYHSIRFSLNDKEEARNFIRRNLDEINGSIERLSLNFAYIDYPGCDNPYEIPHKFFDSKERKMLKGLINQEWLRVAEEIYSNSNPTFLVDMEKMENTIVNQAACDLMDCSEEELLSRKLTKLWVPPGEVKPIDYSKALPPHLQEFHNLLQATTTLQNHKFRSWKPAGDESDAHFVEWTDNIRVIELGGRFYRLMECLEEPKIIAA